MMRSSRLVLAASVLVIAFAGNRAFADERGPNELRLDLGAGYSFRAADDRDGFGFGGAFEYERRLGRYFGLGARVAGLVFPYDTEVYAGPGYASYVGIGPEARLHLVPSMRRGDLWIAGGGQLVITGDLLRAGLDAGLGFDIGVGGGFALGPFARYLHVFQPNGVAQGGHDGRLLFFGVSLSWGHLDGLDNDEEVDEEPADRDADEVLDTDDACPDVAAHTADGCPLAAAVDPDPDHDGVVDPDDVCPTVVGVAPDGCPAPIAPLDADRDTDGVDDARDACPDVAARTADGCPFATTDSRPAGDRDRDGVPDPSDGCPEIPGTLPDGCPNEAAAFEYHLHFDSDSQVLGAETLEQLREVRDRMSAEPRIEYVVILGHADRRGDDDYNRQLSLRRARVVLEWLVRHGISRRRLEARGAGSERQIVDGLTAEELAPNRRVELYIVRPPVDSNP